MTKDEMQRFLDLAAEQGVGELEAARQLWRVLGIRYDKDRKNERKDKPSET